MKDVGLSMILRRLLPVCLLTALGTLAAGQEFSRGEVVGMAGIGVYQEGALADFGGGAGYRLSRRYALVGEFHRVGTEKQETVLGIPVRGKGREVNLLGGIHILFPAGSGKIEPYVSVGSGLCHAKSTFTVPGLRVSFQDSEAAPVVFAGGGIRLLGSERWGIRPEAKIVGGRGGFRLLATVGFFHRFK